MAPVSRRVNESASATRLATVLLPAPAGPSSATTVGRFRSFVSLMKRCLVSLGAPWRPCERSGAGARSLSGRLRAGDLRHVRAEITQRPREAREAGGHAIDVAHPRLAVGAETEED